MMLAHRHVTSLAIGRLLGDWREGPGPAYDKLARRLAQLLADGRLAPGVRVPSERQLALEIGVSRTTVIRSYGVLRSQGLLLSQRGVGSVTRLDDRVIDRFNAWAGGIRPRDDSEPLIDLSRASPRANAAVIDALRAAALQAGALRDHHGYYPHGLEALRAGIALRYASRGVPTSPEQIFITSGAQQAIDLIMRTFIRSRESVIVESPTYPGALDSLRLAGARIVSLDVSAAPWSLDDFESLIVQTGARFAYLIPDFHNPTGRLMDDAQREELVRLCERRSVVLIVDETLAEISLEPGSLVTPLAGFASTGTIVSVGSLSKAVWGGLRVGWVRANTQELSALAATRTAADLGGAPVEQIAAIDILSRFDEFADAQREALLRQRDFVRTGVRQLGWQLTEPRGGLSAWARLPSGSSTRLAEVAYRHGVILIPGQRFSADASLDTYLRLPYSEPVETLEIAFDRLTHAWEEFASQDAINHVLQIV